MFYATDLSNFLDCRHLVTLDRQQRAGLFDRPFRESPFLDLLRDLGIRHERTYLASLIQDESVNVVEIPFDQQRPVAAEATLAILRSGIEVVYQGALGDGIWAGRPDFLIRVNRPSNLGDWSYEALDTKLARSTKGGALIQLCLYSKLLYRLQGIEPELMHVVLGGGAKPEKWFLSRYGAYFRRVLSDFEKASREEAETYPEPNEHCTVCSWRSHCDAQWRRDDSLVLVAGINRSQRKALGSRDITTMAALAGLPLPPATRIDGIGDSALCRVREQARIQVEGRRQRRMVYELIQPIEPHRGLTLLPAPSPGDIFFDIESSAYAFDQGLEYLFGFVTTGDQPGDIPAYEKLRALDPRSEKEAFERFIAMAVDRWARYPDMHIYHYAPYEPTALKRLAGRYNCCGDEIDRFLRAGLLVDLYRVVQQGVRASVESYSIKKLEPLYGFVRDVPLDHADAALHAFDAAMALGELDGDLDGLEKITEVIEGYNRDDCISALRLRDWLEECRAGIEFFTGQTLPRPTPETGDPTENLSAYLQQAATVTDRLTSEAPKDETEWTEAQRARWLLAQLLLWHRREDKSTWWEYHRLRELSDDELQQDKTALGGLQYVGPVCTVKKSIIHRYRFPLQEHAIDRANSLHDPRTQKSPGDFVAIDAHNRTIDLKRGASSTVPHPTALIPYDIIDTRIQRDSLLRLGSWVARNGIEGPGEFRCSRDLLLRLPPRLGAPGPEVLHQAPPESSAKALRGTQSEAPRLTLQDGAQLNAGLRFPEVGVFPHRRDAEAAEESLRRQESMDLQVADLIAPLQDVLREALPNAGENSVERAQLAACLLRDTVLPIQGPPGAGKTYTAARMIVKLVASGRRVGVTANSHKVIRYLLEGVLKAAEESGVSLQAIQKTDPPEENCPKTLTQTNDNGDVLVALNDGKAQVAAGTSWLWAREEMARSVDVLFVDEAGQMSLANVLAIAQAAGSLVLLGDPLQLDQPQKGVHPPGAEVSALAHLLCGKATIGDDQGLFLQQTWRLHPDVCGFTSEVFYEGRLGTRPENAAQRLNTSGPLDGTGLRFAPVEHLGNQSDSVEEVEEVCEIVSALLGSGWAWIHGQGEYGKPGMPASTNDGSTWTDKHGITRPLILNDILIVSPYNAQVSALSARLPKGARVGTVDKFQGQEAPVVIYSMATSTPEDAPRGMEFLYSPNRLNVATSRAQCVAVIVASPALFQVQCKTPRQMELANAFCRYQEMATVI
jgi:predicted RecB family nuclease